MNPGTKFSAALFAAFAITLAARAGDVEQRTFAVSVDAKPAGESRMAVRTHDDGTETLTAVADVQYKHAKGAYHHTYHGTETWKDGKLVRLDAVSDADGKKREITATAADKMLRVTVNGQRSDIRPDVWTTSLLRLPEESRRDKPLPLLNVDSGKLTTGTLEYVATEKLTLVGQMLDCNHYRVRIDGVQIDVWYDGADRLVRQDSVEDGHKVHFELTHVQR